MADELDPTLVDAYIDESTEMLEGIQSLVTDLENNVDREETIASIKRNVHTFKGGSAIMGLEKSKSLAQITETLVEDVKEKKLEATPEFIDVLLQSVDAMTVMVHRFSRSEAELEDEKAYQDLCRKILTLHMKRSD